MPGKHKKFFSPAQRAAFALPPGGKPIQDRTGLRYGRLTCLQYMPPFGDNPNSHWLCKCTCGTIKEVQSNALTVTKSCGCIMKEVARKRSAQVQKKRRVALRQAVCLWRHGPWSDGEFYSFLRNFVAIHPRDIAWAKQQVEQHHADQEPELCP